MQSRASPISLLHRRAIVGHINILCSILILPVHALFLVSLVCRAHAPKTYYVKQRALYLKQKKITWIILQLGDITERRQGGLDRRNAGSQCAGIREAHLVNERQRCKRVGVRVAAKRLLADVVE